MIMRLASKCNFCNYCCNAVFPHWIIDQLSNVRCIICRKWIFKFVAPEYSALWRDILFNGLRMVMPRPSTVQNVEGRGQTHASVCETERFHRQHHSWPHWEIEVIERWRFENPVERIHKRPSFASERFNIILLLATEITELGWSIKYLPSPHPIPPDSYAFY